MRYEPYGNKRGTTEATAGDRTYTGQIDDTATGLMYYNARYYDPNLRTFISADTIIPNPASTLSWNRYSYVHNNPVVLNDPSGHCPPNVPCPKYEAPERSAHETLIHELHLIARRTGADGNMSSWVAAEVDSGLPTSSYSLGTGAISQATSDFVETAGWEVAGMRWGNFLLPEGWERPWLTLRGNLEFPNRISEGDQRTPILGNSGWRLDLVDDSASPARHLVGYVALGFRYGEAAETALLLAEHPSNVSVGATVADVELGRIGIDIGNRLHSGDLTVDEAIAEIASATGDPGFGGMPRSQVPISLPSHQEPSRFDMGIAFVSSVLR